MNSKTRGGLLTLTECSLMIALATVLSTFPLFEMPYGGSITLASFVPIVVIAYRHGIKTGLATASVAAVIQMLLGLKNFSYFTTWQSIVALAIFDYVIAFAIFGLAGIFRKTFKSQPLAVVSGAVFASVVRMSIATYASALQRRPAWSTNPVIPFSCNCLMASRTA